jgi:hypothetical protein
VKRIEVLSVADFARPLRATTAKLSYTYTTVATVDGPKLPWRCFTTAILQSVSEFWTAIRYTVFPISDRHTLYFIPGRALEKACTGSSRGLIKMSLIATVVRCLLTSTV